MLQKEVLFNRMGLTVQTMKTLYKGRKSMMMVQDETGELLLSVLIGGFDSLSGMLTNFEMLYESHHGKINHRKFHTEFVYDGPTANGTPQSASFVHGSVYDSD